MLAKYFALIALLPAAFAGPVKRACNGVTVIFARGTTEPGTIGTIVGPPFENALRTIPGVTFTGVPYPATIAGFLAGGDPVGSRTMANMVQQVATTCPNEKIVMSGYR
jgi:cutinase